MNDFTTGEILVYSLSIKERRTTTYRTQKEQTCEKNLFIF